MVEDLVALGHAAQVTQDQAADGVEFLVGRRWSPKASLKSSISVRALTR